MAKTVAALYENRTAASSAVQDLVDHGFARDDISVLTYDDMQRNGPITTDDSPSGVAQGAGIGAALGGISGLVIGLSALAIPGVGPVLAAGPLAAALVGAGIGAAAGGLIGALTDMGIPEEHVHYYSEGVRRGGVLVTVATTDARAEEAVSILARHNPIDLSRRAEEWRQSGWSRFDPHAEPYHRPVATRAAGMAASAHAGASAPVTSGAAQTARGAAAAATAAGARVQADQHATIPVVEEEMQVGKRAQERDVRVHTTVTEKPVEAQVHLREERVTVERRPVNRPASAADQAAFKEGVIEMTETKEEAVINKRARVVEEVVLNKEVQDRVETVRDTVRRTDVDVEREQAAPTSGLRSFETYDAGFRQHFNTTLAQQPGATYAMYMPAYRYGHTIATDKRFIDRDWIVCEPEARRDWEREHPGTWERFKAAIRHAWDEVRGRR